MDSALCGQLRGWRLKILTTGHHWSTRERTTRSEGGRDPAPRAGLGNAPRVLTHNWLSHDLSGLFPGLERGHKLVSQRGAEVAALNLSQRRALRLPTLAHSDACRLVKGVKLRSS